MRGPFVADGPTYGQIKAALIHGDGASALLASARYPWLEPLAQTFDDHIADYLSDFLATHENPYDPMPVESLVADITALLDRCLLYRREIYDLEAQAVRQALEYELFVKQWSVLKDIDLADQIEKGRAIDATTQSAASVGFIRATDPGLAEGFAQLTAGGAKVANEAVAGEQARKELVARKYDLLKQYQEALESRHHSPGNALNFGERLERLLVFVRDDIRMAYLKAEAAAEGLFSVFRIFSPMPVLGTMGVLDELVRWARKAAEDLSQATAREIVFERIVSLRQMVSKEVYEEGTRPGGQGFLYFGFESFMPLVEEVSGHPGFYYHPRILGLAASFCSPNFADPTIRHRRLTIALFPPSPYLSVGPFRDRGDSEGAPDRPPVILSNVALADPAAPPKWILPESARNLDPAGDRDPDYEMGWTICVSPEVAVSDKAGRVDFDPAEFVDIKIHLLLGMRAANDDRAWRHFPW